MRSAVPRSHILGRVELFWTASLIIGTLAATAFLGRLAHRLATTPELEPSPAGEAGR